jgi:hypothetical protein
MALYNMFMKGWAILGSNKLIVYSKCNINGEGCIYNFNKKKIQFVVWISVSIIQHTYISL